MPRKSKGARLWLRERKGRDPVYVIINGTQEISTECGPDDIEAANLKLAEYISKTFRPDTSRRILSSIAVAEVLALYGADLPENSPSRATRGYHIQALLPYWGSKTLSDVKGSNCRAYVAQRAASSNTARLELKTLQTAINHWHRESTLEAVPNVTLPRVEKMDARWLTRNEAAKLLWACRIIPKSNRKDFYHVSRFIRLGIDSGTRKAALLGLRWQQSLKSGHVDLEQGVLYRKGRGETETSKRRPAIEINGKSLSMLRRWFVMDEKTGARHVINYFGRGVADIGNAFESVCKLAGLDDVTPHTLRHTCATWRLQKNQSIWSVAGLIGADATTVERVYGHHRKVGKDTKVA